MSLLLSEKCSGKLHTVHLQFVTPEIVERENVGGGDSCFHVLGTFCVDKQVLLLLQTLYLYSRHSVVFVLATQAHLLLHFGVPLKHSQPS